MRDQLSLPSLQVETKSFTFYKPAEVTAAQIISVPTIKTIVFIFFNLTHSVKVYLILFSERWKTGGHHSLHRNPS